MQTKTHRGEAVPEPRDPAHEARASAALAAIVVQAQALPPRCPARQALAQAAQPLRRYLGHVCIAPVALHALDTLGAIRLPV